MLPAAFYSMADSRFFVGAVALLNSLRLVGHEEPLYLLDCGLEPWQRDLVDPHVRLVRAPSGQPPHLLTFYAPLEHPALLMVSLDADLIAVRSLHGLMERSLERNEVMAFIDAAERFDPRWGEILGLGSLRKEPYVTNAVVILPSALGRSLFEQLRDAQERIDTSQANFIDNWEATLGSRALPGTLDNPFYFPEQDALNALLSSRIPPERQLRLEHRFAPHPPFRGLRLVDRASLRCEYSDGTQPYLLHHVEMKPWLGRTPPNLYSDLLPRLLVASDLTVALPPERVPLRFRPGPGGRLERTRVALLHAVADNDPVYRARAALHLRTRWRSLRAWRSSR